jgi:FkbM family methyltransferase
MPSIGQRVTRAYRKLRWEMVRGGPGRAPRILTVSTANGVLSFSNMDLHNAKALYVHRAWEIDLITHSMDYLKREGLAGTPGRDILVDVGANLGMICIAMLKRGYFREAIAIEPDPRNFALLNRNIEQNGLGDRIRAFHFAVSDEAGEVELELSDVNFGDHRVRAARTLAPTRMGEERRGTVPVPARRLDDLLRTEAHVDPERIGLVWVDIQGHEGHLFRGARETLGRGVPVISEFWPYGIRRSGLERDAYAEIVRSHFARFVIVDASTGRFEPRDIGAIAELFDAYPLPEQNLELILFPRVDREMEEGRGRGE